MTIARIALLALLCIGCTSTRQHIVLADDLQAGGSDVVLSARLHNGEYIAFAEPGGRVDGPLDPDALATGIAGRNVSGAHVSIPRSGLAEIELRTKKADGLATVSLITVIGSSVAGILLLVFLSGMK